MSTVIEPGRGHSAPRLAGSSALTTASTQLGFAVAFAAAGFAGRSTIIDGGSLSLVWPAAGVAVLWLGWARTRGSRTTVLAAAYLAITTAIVNGVTGATPALMVVFVAANLAQVATAIAAMGSSATDPRSPTTLRGAVRLVLAAAAAAAVGAVVGAIGVAVVLSPVVVTEQSILLWWGRNMTGIIALVALGQLSAHHVAERTTTPRTSPAAARWDVLDMSALFTATVVAFAVLWNGSLASIYPILALTVWAGLRCSPLVATSFSVVTGSITVTLTLVGVGPFAGVTSPVMRAIDVQLYVAIAVIVALVLSASLSDQRLLVARAIGAESEARARADLYTAVAESMTDGVCVLDRHGAVVACNTAAQGLLAAARITDNHHLTLHRTDGSRVDPHDYPSAQAMRDGLSPAQDLVLDHHVGRPLVLSVTASRLEELGPLSDGPGALVVYRDVTAEREQRDELAGFAGMVAHDLRAPLASARGWIELAQMDLRPDTADHDAAVCLDNALRATSRMDDLIDDLLTHASSTGDELVLVDVDLTAMTREVVALHGQHDTVTVETLPTARADATMVHQLLSNLIGNAVKYVPPGVVPRIRVQGGERDGDVVIEVTDNGLGVPADDRDAVFERFYRAHRDRDDIRGSGLGLAMCRAIVERHGGEIHVEDGRDGHGSRFVFTLPGRPLGRRGPRTLQPQASTVSAGLA